MISSNSGSNKGFDPTVDEIPEDMDLWADDVLRTIIKTHKASGKSKRQKLARDWFRSELFYNGIQWVKFDSGMKRWREFGAKKSTPTPVTNTYSAYCDIFASLISSIPLEITYRPLNPSSAVSQGNMKIANDLTDGIEQIVKMKERQRIAAPAFVRQGEVFLIPRMILDGVSLDQDDNPEMAKEPEALLKTLAPQLGESTGETANPQPPLSPGLPIPKEEPSKALGDALTPNTDREDLPKIPKLVLDVASAFECYMDEEAGSLEDSAFFIREKSVDMGVLKEMFPKFAKEIKPTQNISGDISRYFAGSLKRMTSSDSGGSGFFSSAGQTQNNRANLTEYWRDPCPNYPKGLYLMMINDNHIVRKGHLTYHNKDGVYYKNIVQARCKRRTDNVHGRTPMDDAIPKQIQRNKLESFIELGIYRNAAPHWLLPKDCGVQSISGEPGTSIEYNRVSASQSAVLKPEMIPGAPIQPTVLQFLSKIDEDTEYILGITKAFLGQLPPGTPAARALEMLMQRSKDRHGDVFHEWNAKWCEVMNMFLKIVQQVKPLDLFRASKETYGGFSLKVFQEEDFNLDLEIIPETEQPAPARSTTAEMGLIKDFSETGIFQMPPDLQYALLKRFNLTYLAKSLESDKEYIARENYFLLKEGKVPKMKTFDSHPMHFEGHRIFMQSEEYLEWAVENPELAQQMEKHEMGHQEMMQQAQAAQQASQMPAPGPTPQLSSPAPQSV